MFNRISPQALEVMKALSYFHFLTNNHLVELGVAASAHSLNAKAIRELVPKRDDNGNVRTGQWADALQVFVQQSALWRYQRRQRQRSR